MDSSASSKQKENHNLLSQAIDSLMHVTDIITFIVFSIKLEVMISGKFLYITYFPGN